MNLRERGRSCVSLCEIGVFFCAIAEWCCSAGDVTEDVMSCDVTEAC